MYKLDKIFIQSEKIVFCYDSPRPAGTATFGGSVNSDDSDLIVESHSIPILVWPTVKALDARLLLCRTIHLEKARSIEVLISSGWNKIARGKLTLRCGSAGLRLHTADADLAEGQTLILDKSQPGSIVYGALDSESKALFRIPYGLESDLKEIAIKIEVSYSVNDQDFLYICSDELHILLPLSVNVQDTFKERALISKFTVGTATSVPANIVSYEICNTKDFSVTVPPIPTGNLDIFARQPLSIVAKIQRNGSSKENSIAKHSLDAKLTLVIDYSCVDQEFNDAIETQFAVALREGHLERFSRLLIPNLMRTLRSRLSLPDYEAIALFRESPVGSFHELNWNFVMAGLAPKDRECVNTWLVGWHEVGYSGRCRVSLVANFCRTNQRYRCPIAAILLVGTVYLFLSSYLKCP